MGGNTSTAEGGPLRPASSAASERCSKNRTFFLPGRLAMTPPNGNPESPSPVDREGKEESKNQGPVGLAVAWTRDNVKGIGLYFGSFSAALLSLTELKERLDKMTGGRE